MKLNTYQAIAVTPAGRKLLTKKSTDFRTATSAITAILNAQYGTKGEWTYEVEPLRTR